jgi:hypothetical protein
MTDDRAYDLMVGPNRIQERLKQNLKDCTSKGRKLKVKHVKKNYNYSSFDDQPTSVKFDQILSREKAMKPFILEPEGAPFWKYNVKDEIISRPVITHKISENPAHNHNHAYEFTKE